MYVLRELPALGAIGALSIAGVFACSEPAPRHLGISSAEPTGSPTIGRDRLVAAFDFESTTPDGRLRDFSGRDNHGTLARSDLIDGPFGRARRFTSVEDRILLASDSSLDLDGPLSIAAWVRVDQLDLHQHILACDDKYALWVTPANQFRLGDTHGGGYSTTEGFVEAGPWYSVIAVLRTSRGATLHPGDVTLYVDGVAVEGSVAPRAQAAGQPVATWGSGELYPTDACSIGFESHQGNEAHQALPFVGALDEVLVFGRGLSDREVVAFSTRNP